MQGDKRTTSGNLLTAECQMSPSLWEGNRVDTNQAACIHLLFEAQVEKTPDAIAAVFENQTFTYRALNQRANQLAHHLINQGVGADVLVGICVERSLAMLVGLLGILKAGGAYVPLDPTYPAERLAFILDDTQVPVILTQAHLVNSLPACAAQAICLDSDWEALSRNTSENPTGRAIASNLMYVIYTSGSTGKPKGVMIPHAGIWNQLHWRQTTFTLTPADRVLQSISFSFDPSVWQIFWPLSFGAQLVLPVPDGQKDLTYLIQLMVQQQVTVTALVPSLLRVLLAQPALAQCTSLKHVFCGGEALPTELIEQFYQRFRSSTLLHNVYGPTEASIDATFWTCQPCVDRRIAPIGRAIANTQIHILDEHLQPVASGEAGELHISGAGLARGYLNRAKLTAEKFIPDPHSNAPNARLYKTGDLARYLPDGNIEFLGRIDHQVKIRGFRIELGEIETALNQHPLLAETVVIAREDSPGNHRLVAYVVPSEKVVPTTTELRSFLQEKLPEYMVPSAFVVLKALPLNTSGKLDRQALPIPDAEDFALETAFEAPKDALEQDLAQLWEQVLNIHPIGVKDNFFELGGDSLLATRVLAQVETLLGQNLPLAVFQEAATVEKLAEFIRRQDLPMTQKPLVAIQPQGTRPPLFCIHSRNHHVLNYFPLARYLNPDQPVYGLQPSTTDIDLITKLSVEALATEYIGEIRTIQPHGPYFLLGYSFGGLVAYEMARQLTLQGECVALLAMVDTYNLRQPWFRPVPIHRHLFRRLAIHKAALSKRRLREKVSYGWKLLAQDIQKETGEQSLRSLQSPAPETVVIEAAYSQMTQNYSPQSYPGRAILFRTPQAPEEWLRLVPAKIDALLGWSKLIDSLEVCELPCDHFNVVFEPFVQHLAAGLQRYLDVAQGNDSIG
ncbi:MAG: amino acid adenylation domain-containing protein [Lyngbya sp. HA4199-MV5]|jgi:amino acid adenylation domain-containing protein|nr:amino acid adenylation domain-containing protein [Lyngbya sp. HA4199-MV5]